ncbi:hypothetical protein ACFZAV_44990 [Streptomyces sp. NPDC008343]|uniref:hypothetical protein n=1 Tax=Streptomyces sp. NPDC008343 TaxID=3364828 RepID=UPI0036EA1521
MSYIVPVVLVMYMFAGVGLREWAGPEWTALTGELALRGLPALANAYAYKLLGHHNTPLACMAMPLSGVFATRDALSITAKTVKFAAFEVTVLEVLFVHAGVCSFLLRLKARQRALGAGQLAPSSDLARV